jgi:class 3 adenylate cyclase
VSEYADDLIAAGLYNPDGAEAEAMLELLVYLIEELDASIPELITAYETSGLLSLGAFRAVRLGRDRYTLAEIAAVANVDPTLAREVWRSAGFPDPRPYERNFGGDDADMFALFSLAATLVDSDSVLQLVRTMGEAVSRIAEAEVALMRSNIEAPLVTTTRYVDIARAYVQVANELFPRLANALDALHRHHIVAISRRYTDVNAPTSALNVVQLAVGFADLAGYTGLWDERTPDDLAVMLDRFEAITGNVIATAGANVVKRIGDAVMFVTNAPGIACALALDLLESCAAVGLPKLRVGVAFGDVMVRQGDFYGAPVNLAARLVATADAGTALTDSTLQQRLERVRGGYAFLAAGKFNLAGFPAPVEAFQLLRP